MTPSGVTRAELDRYRGEVLSEFARIENLLCKALSIYYVGKLDEEFLSDVLYHDYFSFDMKQRILMDIFCRLNEAELIEKDFMKQLDKLKEQLFELRSIRNDCAHAQVGLNPHDNSFDIVLREFLVEPEKAKKKWGPPVILSIHKKFMNIFPEVFTTLEKVNNMIQNEKIQNFRKQRANPSGRR